MAKKRTRSRDGIARISVRMSIEEKAQIHLAAELLGASAEEFVLQAATDAAAQVLAADRIELSEAASLQVAKALSRPARSVPELVELWEDSL